MGWTWHISSMKRFSENIALKAVTDIIFLLELTDLKNVTFEKIPRAPSEDTDQYSNSLKPKMKVSM